MNDKSIMFCQPVDAEKRRMFAKFDDGDWYAVLPNMESRLRKMGALVVTLPDDACVLDTLVQ